MSRLESLAKVSLLGNPYLADQRISRAPSRLVARPAICTTVDQIRPFALLLLVNCIVLRSPSHAAEQCSINDVKRGAGEVRAAIERRLDYPTTYRLIRGVLEKSVNSGQDSPGFRLGAELATTHWLALLPRDTTWEEKGWARHRDVTHWLARDCGLAPTDIARTVGRALGLAATSNDWLVGILKGEVKAPISTRASTPTVSQ